MVMGWADSSDEEDNLGHEDDAEVQEHAEEIRKQVEEEVLRARQAYKRQQEESGSAGEGESAQVEEEVAAGEEGGDEAPGDDEQQQQEQQQALPEPKTYDFPTEPPFTAFVGSLSFSIVESEELSEKLTALARDILGLEIRIVDTRIMMDRNNQKNQPNQNQRPRHRGFAYVQLETLDMLKGLMELNGKPDATMAGRKILLDTSNSPRRNNSRDNNNNNRRNNPNANNNQQQGLPDGSSFRGGRFQQNRRNNPNNRRNNAEDGEASPNEAPAQRASLKLAPRTKPVDSGNPTNNNIFGGGKARDEQAWQGRQSSGPASTNHKNDGERPAGGGRYNNNQTSSGRGFDGRGRGGRYGNRHDGEGGRGQRDGYRGGRGRGEGRGRGGRGGGRSQPHNNSNRQNINGNAPVTTSKTATPAPAPSPQPRNTAAQAQAEKAPEKKVTNKFAALDFDSDSD